jgi:uncharacterized repeat protein (TIGR01451 family)
MGLAFGPADASAAPSPPTISNAFGAASIALNANTTLTYTIFNPNVSTPLTGIAFTNFLPSGLVVAATPGVSDTCGGTVTAAAGAGTISLSGGVLAASASCTIVVNVQGTSAGVKNNTTGPITSNESTPGSTSNTASITVVAPPVPVIQFGAASIPLHGSTSLSFTISNTNPVTTLHGIGLTDSLPAGLVIATPPSIGGSCGGGTISASSGGTTISLSGATLAAGASCMFSVNVTGVGAGNQNNRTGDITSTEGGTDGTATASLDVIAPPSLSQTFTPPAIAPGGTSQLTFTVANPSANVSTETGVSFTDVLPSGLSVADESATTCSGTLTVTGATHTITLTGATVAPQGQCQFSVTVTVPAAGHYVNTTSDPSSTDGGTGAAATAILGVANPPTISESFSSAQIHEGGTSTLTYTIGNPSNAITLTGLAFTDTLPAGLAVASNPSITNTCGGTLTAAPGAGTVTLASGSLAGAATCTISLAVQGTAPGNQDNAVQITPTDSPPGNTAHAAILVIGPPQIALAFAPSSIKPGGRSLLRIIVTNPNTGTDLTGVTFTSTLPHGMTLAKPANASGSCGGVGLKASRSTLAVANAKLPAGTSCTLTVNVTGRVGGALTLDTGPVSSNEGGEGASGSATLHVVVPNAFTLSHIQGLRLDVKVPGPGKLSASESDHGTIAAVVAHPKRAGTVHLHLKLTSKGRHKLHGTLKVTLKVTFSPTGGKPRTKTVRGLRLSG